MTRFPTSKNFLENNEPLTKEDINEVRDLWMLADTMTDEEVQEFVDLARRNSKRTLTKEELDRARRDFRLTASIPDEGVKWHVDMERLYGDGWPADRFTPEKIEASYGGREVYKKLFGYNLTEEPKK